MALNPSKQLKKQDLLAAITALAAKNGSEPITRAELIDALSEYDFLASYLSYLIDHFEAAGKIFVNDNGDILLKTKATVSKEKTYFRVSYDTETESFKLESVVVGQGDTVPDEGEDWYLTPTKAIKMVCSAIHTQYKENLAAVKALTPAK